MVSNEKNISNYVVLNGKKIKFDETILSQIEKYVFDNFDLLRATGFSSYGISDIRYRYSRNGENEEINFYFHINYGIYFNFWTFSNSYGWNNTPLMRICDSDFKELFKFDKEMYMFNYSPRKYLQINEYLTIFLKDVTSVLKHERNLEIEREHKEKVSKSLANQVKEQWELNTHKSENFIDKIKKFFKG